MHSGCVLTTDDHCLLLFDIDLQGVILWPTTSRWELVDIDTNENSASKIKCFIYGSADVEKTWNYKPTEHYISLLASVTGLSMIGKHDSARKLMLYITHRTTKGETSLHSISLPDASVDRQVFAWISSQELVPRRITSPELGNRSMHSNTVIGLWYCQHRDDANYGTGTNDYDRATRTTQARDETGSEK